MTRLERLRAEMDRLARVLSEPFPPLPGFVDLTLWDEAEEHFDEREWMRRNDRRELGE